MATIEELTKLREKIRLAEEFVDLFLPEQAIEVLSPLTWPFDIENLASALALRARRNWRRILKIQASSEDDKESLREIRVSAKSTYERMMGFMDELARVNAK